MTIFPQFEKQLVELASAATSSAPRRKRRRRVPSASALTAAIASITAIVIAGGAIVLLGHTRGPDRGRAVSTAQPTGRSGQATTPGPKPATSAIDPAVAAQLSVFNQAPTKTDALPTAFKAELRSAYASEKPNVADARRVKASDGQTAYLVPARAGACVINTNEAFCVPAAVLPGAAAVDLCSPALPLGQLEIEWLLPDGATKVALATTAGATRTFAPGFNVYIARLPIHGPLPTTIQWDARGGAQRSASTSIPGNAQSQSCAHPSNRSAHPKSSAKPTATTATVVGPGTATVVRP